MRGIINEIEKGRYAIYLVAEDSKSILLSSPATSKQRR
jgi:hypothetical protein